MEQCLRVCTVRERKREEVCATKKKTTLVSRCVTSLQIPGHKSHFHFSAKASTFLFLSCLFKSENYKLDTNINIFNISLRGKRETFTFILRLNRKKKSKNQRKTGLVS